MRGNLAEDYNRYVAVPQEEEQVVIRKKKIKKLNKDIVASKMYLIVMTVIISSVCLLLVMGYSSISSKYTKIKQLNSTLEEIQNKNLLIKEQIVKNTNLDYIYKDATEKLKMIKPTKDNVNFIYIKKASYTQQFNTVKNDKKRRITFKFLGF